ncbi:ester cyclase [Pendulispora albinea]|uniref:Ester cyclase n=1 Tax=Pendulispora albinea TaxID=2741071 RepID=A0ABZ2M0B5_9BACT
METEERTATLRARREALVRAHMQDENTRDFDKVLATFPHPHYEIIATGAVYDGRDEVRAYYRDSRTAFPDQRNELISLRHTDDAVVVEFWLRGTHQGPFRALPPTGQTIEVRMTAFFIFEGERLMVERVYFDSLTLLKQLLRGVSPKNPASLLLLIRTLLGVARGLR